MTAPRTPRTSRRALAVCLSPLMAAPAAVADLELAAPLGSSMVIQRDAPVIIWGRADAGAEVAVSFRDDTATARAGDDGLWRVELGPQRTAARASAGELLVVTSGDEQIIVEDVVVGDVWIASGQSNMAWPLRETDDAEHAVANARRDDLRLLTVQKRPAMLPEERFGLEHGWTRSEPGVAAEFSAVAFYFATHLLEHGDGTPIGLIDASWGGTPVEAWTPRPTLARLPEAEPILGRWDGFDPRRAVELRRELDAAHRAHVAAVAELMDPEAGVDASPAMPRAETDGWGEAELPGPINADLPSDHNGVTWVRRTIDLPGAWAARELILDLGAIDDYDVTYFNGREVGRTGVETDDAFAHPRRYRVPAGVAVRGENVIAVRVIDTGGFAGVGGGGGAFEVRLAGAGAGASAPVDLSGRWLLRRTLDFADDPGFPPPAWMLERSSLHQHAPAALYNGMVHAMTPMRIAGVIWYQGESNAGRAEQYRTLFPALIGAWRGAFGLPEMPFLFVQLANFGARTDEPGPSAWAELREAQLLTLRGVPRTGMAVAIDAGDADDIHPRDKATVGERLALAAERVALGRDVLHAGPLFGGFRIERDAIRVSFDHARGLRTIDGGPPLGFAIAGPDRVFRWAEARIDGGDVVVRHRAVPTPVAVRYAWADNPEVNLINGAGLPASPFRTDAWPGTTTGRR